MATKIANGHNGDVRHRGDKANGVKANGVGEDISAEEKANRSVGGMFFRALALGDKAKLGDEKWEYTEEPHTSRRQEILRKYPEVKNLFGYDPSIARFVSVEVVGQLAISYVISYLDPPVWLILILAWFGGFPNHSLGAAIHEIGHNLAFGHERGWANRLLGLWSNLPIIVPLSVSYKKYHHEHHRWLGQETYDVDIPCRWEMFMFRSPITKLIWLTLMPLLQGIRPWFKSPKGIQGWEFINIVVQLGFDALWVSVAGWKAVFYLLMSTLLGLGVHPLSGHFISEHYLFSDQDRQATRSYYGPLNWWMFNLGYHVEHHDFPYIPSTRLPELHRICPEYYAGLGAHRGWCRMLFDFVWYSHIGPQTRSITDELISKPHPPASHKDQLQVNDCIGGRGLPPTIRQLNSYLYSSILSAFYLLTTVTVRVPAL